MKKTRKTKAQRTSAPVVGELGQLQSANTDGEVQLPVEQVSQLVSRKGLPLLDFFRESPLVGLDFDFKRDKDAGLDI